MRKGFIIVFAVALSSTLYSQHTVDGWDKAKWGMTVTEVKKLYPDCLESPQDDNSTLFEIDGDSLRLRLQTKTTLFGYEFDVLFVFKDSKLSLINLEYRGEHNRDFIYGIVLNKLKEKYGEPSTTEDTHVYYLYFKNGKIELSYLDFSKTWPVTLTYLKKVDNGL